MRRRVFDLLASLGGLLVAVVLVIAGALLMWGASFTNSSVHNQELSPILRPTSSACPSRRGV